MQINNKIKSKVNIINDTNVTKGITMALSLIDELPDLIRNRHIAIKPNDTWATNDDKTACTQPEALKAVIRYVKKFKPGKITVSGGAGAGETKKIFTILGLDKVIQNENVEFFDHNRPPFKEIQLTNGPQKKVIINPHILEYETLISLAQHKVHDSAGVTLTMKNIALSFPAADYYGHPRNMYRHEHNLFGDLQAFIAAMCARFPIDIGIITGYPAMTGTGPIGGKTFNSGLTITSTDMVAVDKIGAEILGNIDVLHIRKAAAMGLGTDDLRKIECSPVTLGDAVSIFLQRSK